MLRASMEITTTDSKPRKSRRKRPVQPKQQLVTVRQASEITGIPYGTLRDLHFRGHLPVVKLPDCDRWWIRRADLDALIDRSVETVA